MEPVVIAVLVGIAVYCVIVALIPRHILVESTRYTRGQLEQLHKEVMPLPEKQDVSVLREQIQKSGFMSRVFFTLPFATAAYPRIIKAGLAGSIEKFFSICLIILLLMVFFLRGYGLKGVAVAWIVTYLFAWWVIKVRIKRRNSSFLNVFPEALDMIVRSVRSGYPLAASVRMVADNMQPPVSTEFKQVSDEVVYGSTLIDALTRLSRRIDEPDVRFFVVMLAVQQEVGGNLSEVLNNLATIIRKRKHLRLKIRAMTSEGRMTAYVLGAIPLFVAGIISWVSPTHFEPLFNTDLGNMLLGAAVLIYLVGGIIVWRIVNMEV